MRNFCQNGPGSNIRLGLDNETCDQAWEWLKKSDENHVLHRQGLEEIICPFDKKTFGIYWKQYKKHCRSLLWQKVKRAVLMILPALQASRMRAAERCYAPGTRAVAELKANYESQNKRLKTV